NYFMYVFEDDETYPGYMVYGIGIYGLIEEEQEPSEPVTELYYAFNIQNTTSTIDGSYKNTVNQSILFTDSANKVDVKVSYLANITGSAPSGLSVGKVFASSVSGVSNAQAYLEIDTKGNDISYFTFDILARNNFASGMTGAKVQVWNGTTWTDLVGGNFYLQIQSEKVTITIENVNASKFRLLFQGTGSSNAGQFMMFDVKLYQTSAPATLTWTNLVTDLGSKFSEPLLSTLLPELEELSNLALTKL